MEARTTSRPHGDMDIDPTGCSTWNELSSSKVGLSKAEVSGRGSIELDILNAGTGPLGQCRPFEWPEDQIFTQCGNMNASVASSSCKHFSNARSRTSNVSRAQRGATAATTRRATTVASDVAYLLLIRAIWAI